MVCQREIGMSMSKAKIIRHEWFVKLLEGSFTALVCYVIHPGGVIGSR